MAKKKSAKFPKLPPKKLQTLRNTLEQELLDPDTLASEPYADFRHLIDTIQVEAFQEQTMRAKCGLLAWQTECYQPASDIGWEMSMCCGGYPLFFKDNTSSGVRSHLEFMLDNVENPRAIAAWISANHKPASANDRVAALLLDRNGTFALVSFDESSSLWFKGNCETSDALVKSANYHEPDFPIEFIPHALNVLCKDLETATSKDSALHVPDELLPTLKELLKGEYGKQWLHALLARVTERTTRESFMLMSGWFESISSISTELREQEERLKLLHAKAIATMQKKHLAELKQREKAISGHEERAVRLSKELSELKQESALKKTGAKDKDDSQSLPVLLDQLFSV